jgi:hypothetical protein
MDECIDLIKQYKSEYSASKLKNELVFLARDKKYLECLGEKSLAQRKNSNNFFVLRDGLFLYWVYIQCGIPINPQSRKKWLKDLDIDDIAHPDVWPSLIERAKENYRSECKRKKQLTAR